MKLVSVQELKVCKDLSSAEYDAIVVVAPAFEAIKASEIRECVQEIGSVDEGASKGLFITKSKLPSKRLVYSGTGPLERDYDDVRRFEDAATKGVEKAIGAGAKAPLLLVCGHSDPKYSKCALTSILGALKAVYVPFDKRDAADVKEEAKVKVKQMGIFCEDKATEDALALAYVIEDGKIVCRDIGGGDPEIMAAPRVEDYVVKAFKGSCIKIKVEKGQDLFEKEYPCFAAVNRAAAKVNRHDGRIIWLTYEPEGGAKDVKQTVMLVGKGVTYDTGGADIKTGGIMAGMSRDKCGAAVVAGLFKVAERLKPKNIKLVGAMCMVRNSVGSECYVSDEIVTSRSGVRMRIGNTDAEGRMAMVDVLCKMKEMSAQETNPHLMTVATLTGSAVYSVGKYTAAMDNGPAREVKFSEQLRDMGDLCADPYEVCTIRKDDYDINMDESKAFVEVLQCINASQGRKPRGHHWAMAFMDYVSGLKDHMLKSERPLKYTHLDIAGSSGFLPGPTTASTLTSLTLLLMTDQ